jgi:hypothetical protein
MQKGGCFSMTKKMHNEIYRNPTKHWEVLAYLIHPDGTKELVRNIDFNIVVQNMSVAIACLMKRQTGYYGLLYWAVGSGGGTWSEDNPPNPSETDSTLETETYRKAINTSDIVFIDSNNVVSGTPTNRIQVTVAFGTTEANGKLMEFGLFAGNATATAGSGIMVNHKTHAVITKTNVMQLEYVIRMTF